MPGFVPIIIDDFQPPVDGQQLAMNLTCALKDADNPNEMIQITFEESEPTASSCEDIAGLTAVTSPQDPTPFENDTITATVFPLIAGCPVSYTVEGTDNYFDIGSPTTDNS